MESKFPTDKERFTCAECEVPFCGDVATDNEGEPSELSADTFTKGPRTSEWSAMLPLLTGEVPAQGLVGLVALDLRVENVDAGKADVVKELLNGFEVEGLVLLELMDNAAGLEWCCGAGVESDQASSDMSTKPGDCSTTGEGISACMECV